MPAAKPPQAGERIFQVMIFDVRSCGIQPIRCAGGEVACRANGGGRRMERVPSLVTRLIEPPAGGPAQCLHGFLGLLAKLRRLFG